MEKLHQTYNAEFPELVIRGITSSGQTFRPSDWAERLAGLVSRMGKDNRLNYCPCVQPVTRSGVRCVVVSRSLEQDYRDIFQFLMDFARDNDLEVSPGREQARGRPQQH